MKFEKNRKTKSARPQPRARYETKYVPHKMLILPVFSVLTGCVSARAAARAHFLCTPLDFSDYEEFFDYLIVTVALKLTEIEAFQVIKKLNTFTPPHVPNERLITQRVSLNNPIIMK